MTKKLIPVETNFKVKILATDSVVPEEATEELGDDINWDEINYAEDLILICSRHTRIGPRARHLFGLYCPKLKIWLCSNQKLDEFIDDRTLHFRLRYRPFSVLSLKEIDKHAFDYYFFQLRHDFIHGHYDKGNDSVNKQVYGLAVADIARYIIEQNIAVDKAFDHVNFAHFLPSQYYGKKIVIELFKKTQVLHTLNAAYENSRQNGDYIKQTFMESFNENFKPSVNQSIETYHVGYSEMNNPVEIKVDIQLDPRKGLAIRSISDSKSEFRQQCKINDIGYISVINLDQTLKQVEINRTNGVPLKLTFANEFDLKSFVSLLDGYYRLSEKWFFNLCGEISSPYLTKLKSMKCHGPVGTDFARKKLQEKGRDELGSCIIWENMIKYDEYKIAVNIGNGTDIVLEIVKFSDGYSVGDSEVKYSSFSDIVHNYIVELKDQSREIPLKTCIPPSVYDQLTTLMLCCPPHEPQNVKGSHSVQNGLSDWPRIIPDNEIKLNLAAVWTEKLNYSVGLALLKNQKVVVKSIKNEKSREEYMDIMSKWIHVKSDCIIHFYGMNLHSPLTFVMEYFPCGPLDKFLEIHKNSLKPVDLIEAISHAARALWYMETNGLVHGHIRCRSLFVSHYSNHWLKVKLCDPLKSCDKIRDALWLPPESKNSDKAHLTIPGDVWAFGTTFSEILNYGHLPKCDNIKKLIKPQDCSDNVWKIINECWAIDPDSRKEPISIVRDIQQIFTNLVCRSIFHKPKDSKHKQKSVKSIFNDSVSSASTLISNVTGSISSWVKFSDSSSDPSDELNEPWIIRLEQLNFEQQPLGQGFHGEVVKTVLSCCQGLKHEEVAVKKIKSSENGRVDLQLTDMKREIEIMKSLNHKNIVQIKGFVESPLMLVMEYIELGSLLSYLEVYRIKESKHKLPLSKFASDIAEGMEYLESKSVVHRDLAARNILVANHNEVKISDFGLAQIIDPANNYYYMQTPRNLPLNWYAPESLGEMIRFSSKSDVWSYGVTLWEMYSFGNYPEYKLNPNALNVKTALVEAFESGQRLDCPPDCPHKMYEIMCSCWNINSEKRPSFTQLKKIIQNIK